MKSILLAITILYGQCAFAQNLVFVFLNQKADGVELPKEQIDKIMEGFYSATTTASFFPSVLIATRVMSFSNSTPEVT